MNKFIFPVRKIKQERKQLIVCDLEGSHCAKMKEKVKW